MRRCRVSRPALRLHDEFEALSRCGMSNAQILASTTRQAAEWLGTLADRGTVEAGKRADLVLLDAIRSRTSERAAHRGGDRRWALPAAGRARRGSRSWRPNEPIGRLRAHGSATPANRSVLACLTRQRNWAARCNGRTSSLRLRCCRRTPSPGWSMSRFGGKLPRQRSREPCTHPGLQLNSMTNRRLLSELSVRSFQTVQEN